MSNDKEKNNKKEQAVPLQPEKVEKGIVIPPEIEEVLKTAPPQIKKAITEMATLSVTGAIQPQVHPLFHKFSSQHIDKFLDYTHADDQNNYKLESSGRWINLVWAAIILGFLVFLVVYLAKDNVVLLSDILKILIAFAGGFGGGFGYRAYLGKSK